MDRGAWQATVHGVTGSDMTHTPTNVFFGEMSIQIHFCFYFILILSCMNCLNIFEINALLVAASENIFSHSEVVIQKEILCICLFGYARSYQQLWNVGSSLHNVGYFVAVWAQQLHVGSVAPSMCNHSSLPRDQTHISSIARWILTHWTTRD